MNNWHTLSTEESFKQLASEEYGLTESEANSRLALHGPNALGETKTDSVFSIFLRQFRSPIIYILLSAAIIMFVMSHPKDGVIILLVLIINAIIGSIQEGRAQNTLAALKHMVKTNANLMRNKREIIVPSEEVVPGDIIILKEGDKVPADARIFRSESLHIDEASLTGESEPVSKNTDIITDPDITPADQKNMVFKGTYVVRGEARAIVTATGIKTLIGGISEKLVGLDTDVPLKKEIQTLSRIIIMIVLVVSSFIFVIGLMRGVPVGDMFITAVAIAVSATPEGLPVVVTIVLAAGMYRMSKRNALVRRLQAVEALGQAEVIAVDKTGTITLNQMMVEKVYVDQTTYDVSGNGYEPKGEISKKGVALEPIEHKSILLMGRIASLTASAALAYSEEKQEWQRLSGDPTEAALLSFSQKIGFEKESLVSEHPKVFEIPFNSNIKYHAAAHTVGNKTEFYVAGAPEIILKHAKHVFKKGRVVRLTKEAKEEMEKALIDMAQLGLRVVALAVHFDSASTANPLTLPELCFVGFTGISDSVRPGARDALLSAHEAGIKVVMITGDFPETAKAVAQKVGIYTEGDIVMTGAELASLSESELAEKIRNVSVFARVTPEDKLSIIEAYRKQKIIIAMTGDGVNDALSLAAADLGVSMGKIGTEVAKEASDIVLLDDNFGSIVAAVEEGRNIYQSIKKVILYLFSAGLGEVLTIIAAILIGFPVPLLAGQIIWLNFVTDGFLVVALALEPKDKNVRSIGRKRVSHMIDRLMVGRISLMSITMAFISVCLFALYFDQGFTKASTVALTSLAVCQWFNTFNCRSHKRSIFGKHSFSNPYLLGALVIVIILQILAIYTTPLQNLISTVPLSFTDWQIIIGAGLLIILVEEIRKLISRIRA